MEYKHIFLPLRKLVSKILYHVFIVMLQLHNLLVSKWRQWYRKPIVKSIEVWYSKSVETGSFGDLNRSDRPSVSETADAVREAFQRSPGKWTGHASNRLRVPKSTVVKILHKRPKLYAYKVQIVKSLQLDDGPRRASLVTEILRRIDEDNDYFKRVCFSDEATFHNSSVVNRHNVRTWGSENQNFF